VSRFGPALRDGTSELPSQEARIQNRKCPKVSSPIRHPMILPDPLRRPWFELCESFVIAWREMMANRVRSLLTALGVIIGIIAVTLMGAAIRGVDISFNRSMSPLGDDVFYVEQFPWDGDEDFWSFRNRPTIKSSYAEDINRIVSRTPRSLLSLAVPAPNTTQTVSYQRRLLTNITVMGTTTDFSSIISIDCLEGRFLNDAESRGGSDVCVLGFDVAKGLFEKGSPIGKKVKIADTLYRVVGVLRKQGSFLGLFSWDAQAVIPLKSYLKYFDANLWNASIRVKAKDKSKMDEARQELRGVMRRVRGVRPEKEDDFSINAQDALRKTLDPIKAGLAAGGLFITGLALFVGAIGIMNITFVSVKERTREIGTRRALGARRRTILLQFLIESISICLIGGICGVVLSFGLFLVVGKVFSDFPIEFSYLLVLEAMLISVVTGIVSGFAPAWQASRLNPVEALRYE
jgi:putative ABC transport system permease protein